MPVVNLKDIDFSHYKYDVYVEVSEEIAELFTASDRKEETYQRKLRRYGVVYSLDAKDEFGIQPTESYSTLFPPHDADKKLANEIMAILQELSNRQASRLYAHVILGLSVVAIAKKEGVTRQAVNESIKSARQKIKKIFFERKRCFQTIDFPEF